MEQDSPQVIAIKARYKASLADKADIFGEYVLKQLAAPRLTEPQYKELNDDLHKLAGSSGMYGYLDISNLARSMMEQIQQQRYERVAASLEQLLDLILAHANS